MQNHSTVWSWLAKFALAAAVPIATGVFTCAQVRISQETARSARIQTYQEKLLEQNLKLLDVALDMRQPDEARLVKLDYMTTVTLELARVMSQNGFIEGSSELSAWATRQRQMLQNARADAQRRVETATVTIAAARREVERSTQELEQHLQAHHHQPGPDALVDVLTRKLDDAQERWAEARDMLERNTRLAAALAATPPAISDPALSTR